MMIDILLATYNSEHYLSEQINSVLAQTFQEWRLLVHDGGSTDNTLRIIKTYASRDSRIHYLGTHRMDAVANFAHLWSQSDAEYVMFCDHDDVWMPDKIERTFQIMRTTEAETVNQGKGILVFTDACVVNAMLELQGQSSWEWQGLNPNYTDLRHLLVQNVASGNTMLINQKLKSLCGDISPKAVMHDHWISLLASTLGVTVYLAEPTLLYRQHGNNVFGASQYSVYYFGRCMHQGIGHIRMRFYRNVTQAKAFLLRYGSQLKPTDYKCLQEFASLDTRSWLMRRVILIRWGIWKTGIVRNLATLFVV